MTEVTIRRLVWTMLSLFTLSFWINLSILIEWSTLVENNDADVNRCIQPKYLCRYRYPIVREPKDHSITAGPDWNTTAVGEDADSSVSRFVSYCNFQKTELQKTKSFFFLLFITSDLEDAVATSNAAVTAIAVRMRRTCTVLRPEVV
jgi:hypothetical protein